MPVIYCTRCLCEGNSLIKTIDYNSAIYKCNSCGCIHMVMGSRHFTVVEPNDIYNTIPKFEDAVKMAEAARDISTGIKVNSDAHSSYDAVNHPSHYANGMTVELECIMFKRWLPGDLSDAFKYVWRDGDKDDPVQDLEKAVWYLDDALEYGINFNEPKLVPFLPKSSLPEWKYKALRCILTDRLSDARQIVVEQLHGMTATAQNDRKH